MFFQCPEDDASVPTYGEDILGLSNRRTRFLYVPLEKLRRGITSKDVEAEIHRAAALISEGKVVPFSPETWLRQVFNRNPADCWRIFCPLATWAIYLQKLSKTSCWNTSQPQGYAALFSFTSVWSPCLGCLIQTDPNIALPHCWVWWTLNPNSCSRVCSCTPPKLIWQPRRTFWCPVWRLLVHLLKFVKVSRRSHGHVLALPNSKQRASQDDNLSIFGRIIRELSLQSERSRRGLQGRGQEDGGFLDFLMVCSAKLP